MDPNAQNPQGDSSAVNKLEQDLQNLKQEAPVTPQQPVPVVEPLQPLPQVPEETPAPPVPSVPSASPVEAGSPIPDVPKKGSPLMIVAIILAVIAVLAVVIYVLGAKFLTPGTKQTACTMEAKVCPDGSSVGRTGPNCEFAACPSPTATADPTANWKTYTNTAFGYSFKYPSDTKVETLYVDKSVIPNPTPLEKSSSVWFSLDSNNTIGVSVYKENTIQKGPLNYKLDNLDASRNFVESSHSFDDIVTVIKSPYDYSISLEGEKDKYTTVFNQVLSTFKFVEATSAGSPTASPTSSPSATVTP